MLLNTGNIDVQKLLAGDVSGKKITHIAVGTNSADVAAGDNALTNQVAKPVTDVNYLANNIVEFVASLGGEDPAMTIQEIGLLNEDGALCFRKVIPAKNKTAGLTYALIYRVKIK